MDFLGTNGFLKNLPSTDSVVDPIDLAAELAASSYFEWGYKDPIKWLIWFGGQVPGVSNNNDISYWSHSQAQSHSRCALLRWMEKVLGLRGRSGAGADFGSLRHTELENFMLGKIETSDMHSAARALLPYLPPREAVQNGQVLVETEISGLTHFFPFPVKGKIDLLDRRVDIWRLRDYKFLAPSSLERAPTADTIGEEIQLNLYSFWVWDGDLKYRGKYLDIGQEQVNKKNHQVYRPSTLITRDQCLRRMESLLKVVEQIQKMNAIRDPALISINAPNGPGKSPACKMYGRNGEVTCRGVALCRASREVQSMGLRDTLASLPTTTSTTKLPDGSHQSKANGGWYAVRDSVITYYSRVPPTNTVPVSDANLGWTLFDPSRHPGFDDAPKPSGYVGVNPPEGAPGPAPLLQPGQLMNAPLEDNDEEDTNVVGNERVFIEEGIPKAAAKVLLNMGIDSLDKLRALPFDKLKASFGAETTGWKGLEKTIKKKGWKMGDETITVINPANGPRLYKCDTPLTAVACGTPVGRLEGDDLTVLSRLPEGAVVRNNKDGTTCSMAGLVRVLGARPHPVGLRVRMLADMFGLARNTFGKVEQSDTRVTRILTQAGTYHDIPTWVLDRALEPNKPQPKNTSFDNSTVRPQIGNNNNYYWLEDGENPSHIMFPEHKNKPNAQEFWIKYDPSVHLAPNEPPYLDLEKYAITDADFVQPAVQTPPPPPVVQAPVVQTPPPPVVQAPVVQTPPPPVVQAPPPPVVQAPPPPVVQAPVVQAPVVQAPVVQPAAPPVVSAPSPTTSGLIVIEGRLSFGKGSLADLFPGYLAETWVQALNDTSNFIQASSENKVHPTDMKFDEGKKLVKSTFVNNLQTPQCANYALIVEDPNDPYWVFVRSWVLPLAKLHITC